MHLSPRFCICQAGFPNVVRSGGAGYAYPGNAAFSTVASSLSPLELVKLSTQRRLVTFVRSPMDYCHACKRWIDAKGSRPTVHSWTVDGLFGHRASQLRSCPRALGKKSCIRRDRIRPRVVLSVCVLACKLSAKGTTSRRTALIRIGEAVGRGTWKDPDGWFALRNMLGLREA